MVDFLFVKILKIVATGKNGATPPCGRCRELIKQINEANMKTQIMFRVYISLINIQRHNVNLYKKLFDIT